LERGKKGTAQGKKNAEGGGGKCRKNRHEGCQMGKLNARELAFWSKDGIGKWRKQDQLI